METIVWLSRYHARYNKKIWLPWKHFAHGHGNEHRQQTFSSEKLCKLGVYHARLLRKVKIEKTNPLHKKPYHWYCIFSTVTMEAL